MAMHPLQQVQNAAQLQAWDTCQGTQTGEKRSKPNNHPLGCINLEERAFLTASPVAESHMISTWISRRYFSHYYFKMYMYLKKKSLLSVCVVHLSFL